YRARSRADTMASGGVATSTISGSSRGEQASNLDCSPGWGQVYVEVENVVRIIVRFEVSQPGVVFAIHRSGPVQSIGCTAQHIKIVGVHGIGRERPQRPPEPVGPEDVRSTSSWLGPRRLDQHAVLGMPVTESGRGVGDAPDCAAE